MHHIFTVQLNCRTMTSTQQFCRHHIMPHVTILSLEDHLQILKPKKKKKDKTERLIKVYCYTFMFFFRHFTKEIRLRGYKIFSMLNSLEHDILNAHKYKNIKKLSVFQAQISLECYFMLITVKMPIIVGILTFISRKNFMLN